MNVKNLKQLALLFMAATMIFASCSKKGANHANLMPQNVNMVASMNFHNLAQKADFENGNYQFMNSIKDEMKSDNEKMNQLMTQIMEDPSKSGIDFKQDMIFFAYSNNEKMNMASTMMLEDASTFQNFIVDMAAANDETIQFIETDGISYMTEEENADEAVIAIKDNILLTVFSPDYKQGTTHEDLKAEAIALFQNLNNSQPDRGEAFTAYNDTKADIKFLLGGKFQEDMQKAMKHLPGASMPFNMPTFLTNNFSIFSLNFENGKIAMKQQAFYGDEMKEFLKENPYTKDNQIAEIAATLPAQNLLAFSGSMKIETFEKMVTEMLKGTDEDFTKEIPQDAKDIFTKIYGALNGDVVFQVSDLKFGGMIPMPEVSMAMSLRNEDLNHLLDSVLEGLIQPVENYFQINSPLGMPVYLFHNSEVLLASTSVDIVKNYATGKLTNEFAKSDAGKKMSEHPFYFILDLQAIAQLEGMESILMTIPGLKPTFDKVERMEGMTTDMENGEFNIIFADKDQNALKTILTSADELANM